MNKGKKTSKLNFKSMNKIQSMANMLDTPDSRDVSSPKDEWTPASYDRQGYLDSVIKASAREVPVNSGSYRTLIVDGRDSRRDSGRDFKAERSSTIDEMQERLDKRVLYLPSTRSVHQIKVDHDKESSD